MDSLQAVEGGTQPEDSPLHLAAVGDKHSPAELGSLQQAVGEGRPQAVEEGRPQAVGEGRPQAAEEDWPQAAEEDWPRALEALLDRHQHWNKQEVVPVEGRCWLD